MRSILRMFVVAALFLVGKAPLGHAEVSMGANLGFAVMDPKYGDTWTFVDIPSNSGYFTTVRPGLRVGLTGKGRRHEAYTDLSLDYVHFNYNSNSWRSIRAALNYQFNLNGAAVGPYVTGGGGLLNTRAVDQFGGDWNATAATMGGGLGLGIPVSAAHGRVRAEARLDHIFEGKNSNGAVIIDQANVYGLVFGFDLWL